ncbi:MAG TPA: hypothetical protein VNY73_04140 [Bacteroidia bacterium]|jgi:hypothetical protein|nr:hypothetical protein [Bacteroidia bacterium]
MHLSHQQAMTNETKKYAEPNPHESLRKDNDHFVSKLNGKWPKKNTAFLINHGIGNQKPIETLDVFARGIIKALQTYNGIKFEKLLVEHHLQPKKNGDETYYWFDNFIRIRNLDSPDTYIDIYEYYWANQTENKTDYRAILAWLSDVVKGASAHYADNAVIASNCDDKSIFIDKNGKLNYWKYFFILRVIGSAGIFIHLFMSAVIKYVKLIPAVGPFIALFLESIKPKALEEFSNVVGDISIYNDPNPRSSNQDIRKAILTGCVKAIKFLVEPTIGNNKTRYDQVVIAAHSLGTQISFDAINRITHQINIGELDGYDNEGYRIDVQGSRIMDINNKPVNINQILNTYITFGSPLDKVAFFFREQSEKNEYVKRQVLENFHCFKQRQWISLGKDIPVIKCNLHRVFDNITWRNYFDNKDYVSGSLDYYQGLTNVNCSFKKGVFTHSNYWSCNEFFGDILINVL